MSRIQTLLIHRPFSVESGLACSPGFFIHFFWTKKTSDTVFFISGSSCHPPIDQASGEGDNSNCNGGDSMSTYFCLLMAGHNRVRILFYKTGWANQYHRVARCKQDYETNC